MDLKTYDLAVIGAGAAGLMASISAGRRSEGSSKSILLLDSKNKIGAKILISGGTRCNVTNRKVTPQDYQGGAKHFIKHVLESFTPQQTISFFEEIGVELVLEPTGKYFPTTHSGKTVLEALIREADRLGVQRVQGAKVRDVIPKEGGFEIFFLGEEEQKVSAKKVILCTGGLSYPETGSDGAGFTIAKKLGHALAPTFPSLTPLATLDPDWPKLSGVALEAKIFFYKGGRKSAESKGSFLFTHFGFSGPACLDISRHIAACPDPADYTVSANFLPDETPESLTAEFQKNAGSAKKLKNFLTDTWTLPASFAEIFLEKMGYDPEMPLKKILRPQKRKLIHDLQETPLFVSGVLGYKKAEATAGGVELSEVRVSTMESKKTPGLYFAGEVLDVDGRIGGFNFQWAWSSGALAGRSAMKALL